MTQLDTEKTESKEDKRSMVPWLVAAAATVILGVAIILVTQSTEEAPPATQLTPTTVADAAPTTVVTPTTLDPVEAAWQEIPLFVGRGRGELRTVSFAVPFSFDTGDATWVSGSLNSPERFGMFFEGMVVLVDVIPGLDSIDATVEAFADWQATYPDTEMTEAVPASVGGAEGVVFETFGLPFEDPDNPSPFTDPEGINYGGGEFTETFVVDVNGQILIVAHTFAKNFPGDAVPAYEQEEYDAANASAKAIIDSIVWKDLN